MAPEDFKRARQLCGRSTREWGLALGYTGPHVSLQVRRMEAGDSRIGPSQARLAAMFVRHGVPPGWDEGVDPDAYAWPPPVTARS